MLLMITGFVDAGWLTFEAAEDRIDWRYGYFEPREGLLETETWFHRDVARRPRMVPMVAGFEGSFPKFRESAVRPNWEAMPHDAD